MGIEIERKFLLANDEWRGLGQGLPYCQGYLGSGGNGATIRVRTIADKGYLTIKGMTEGISRAEYEYQIPYPDALEMLENLCLKPLIKKIRYTIPATDGYVWEVDEFLAENTGLLVAEIELKDPGAAFFRPPWIGKEVTDDPRYRNSNLARNPYTLWTS